MEEKKPFGKMKAVGYSCIAFAGLLSIIGLIRYLNVDKDTLEMLIKFWGAMGIWLLLGNASKRIVGAAVMNKSSQSESDV